MATRDKPEAWLELLQKPGIDDLKLANFVLMDLVHYVRAQRFQDEDTAKLIALFTALRMDQLGKTAQEVEPPLLAKVEQLKHERGLLAEALGKLLVHHHIIRADAAMTGPELLLAVETALLPPNIEAP